MRLILILWIIPIVVFWGWYGLSAYDMSMGSFFFTRAFHDHMFRLYGSMLGVPPEEVPMLIAGTFAFDTLLLMAMSAARWHKKWFPQTKKWVLESLNMAPERTNEQNLEAFADDIETFATTTSLSHSGEKPTQPERSIYPMHPAE